METGDTITRERTFTNEEIILFGELTHNTGTVHKEPDESGRLMVQGLLTASLITEIGGELNFLGNQMNFNFVRAVYAGDMITCKLRLDRIEESAKRTKAWASYECTNQNNETVLTGDGKGILISLMNKG